MDWFKHTPLDNTPLDLPSWRMGKEAETSHLPVETYTPSEVRDRWIYRDGHFEYHGHKIWVEVRKKGHPSHFRELHRSQKYVDMYNAKMQLHVRLTTTLGLARKRTDAQWGRWGYGHFR